MSKIENQAQKHATRIEWDTDKAMEYAVALLTEVNLHTEAAALIAAHEKKMADFYAAMEREFGAESD